MLNEDFVCSLDRPVVSVGSYRAGVENFSGMYCAFAASFVRHKPHIGSIGSSLNNILLALEGDRNNIIHIYSQIILPARLELPI